MQKRPDATFERKSSEHTRLVALAIAAAVCSFGAEGARAQDVDEPVYFTLGAGAAGPVSDPANDQFSAGGDGSVGVYVSLLPELALGGRVIAGALSEGSVVPQDPVDRGVLDYGLLAASLRLHPLASVTGSDHRASGLYLGLSPGGAILDGEVVPAYAASVGYDFPAGPVLVGPALRFTHFIETQGRFGGDDVLTLTGGLEVAFLDRAERIPEPEPGPVPIAELPALPEPEPEPPPIVEAPAEPQVNAALAVAERAYFDYDGAELRAAGRDALDRVVEHYRRWGLRYERLVISGHADDRGASGYNETLSAARALAVANYLVENGVPVEVLQIEAFGEVAPIVADAESAYDHQVNRRVELDVQWRDELRPVGVTPAAEPPAPAYVDAAPEHVQRNPEVWADARPRSGEASRAERLFEQQQQALWSAVQAPVTIAMGPSSDRTEARRVHVQLREDGAVARR